jgi:hypothetical protein
MSNDELTATERNNARAHAVKLLKDAHDEMLRAAGSSPIEKLYVDEVLDILRRYAGDRFAEH